MHAVLLTVHALIVVTLIGVVLLQRSDGGALGLGGGGGGGGFMTSRGAANVLTRTTSVLAALFFATSILLAITAGGVEQDRDIIEELTGERVADPNAPVSTEDLLDTLGTGESARDVAPAAQPELETTPLPAEEAPEASSDAARASPTEETAPEQPQG